MQKSGRRRWTGAAGSITSQTDKGIFDKTEISYTAPGQWGAQSLCLAVPTKVANLMHRGMTRNQDALAQQGGAVDGENQGPKRVQQRGEAPGGMKGRESVTWRYQGGAIRGRAIPSVPFPWS